MDIDERKTVPRRALLVVGPNQVVNQGVALILHFFTLTTAPLLHPHDGARGAQQHSVSGRDFGTAQN